MFDSWEDAMKEIDQARRIADTQVRDWQRELEEGDYYLQYSAELGFPIFGKILESGYTGAMENYRFTFAFSEACPLGERGDIHVCVVTSKIDESTFNAMWKKLNPGAAVPDLSSSDD
jgi:hypothetical protein